MRYLSYRRYHVTRDGHPRITPQALKMAEEFEALLSPAKGYVQSGEAAERQRRGSGEAKCNYKGQYHILLRGNGKTFHTETLKHVRSYLPDPTVHID